MKLILLTIGVLFFPALANADAADYKPQAQIIRYQFRVPSEIRRATKKYGPTRFYGVFEAGTRTFAVQLSDQSAIKLERRKSRLDVWLLQGKLWQIFQSFAFTRQVADKHDRLLIEAQSLWLNPARREVPFIHLHLGEKSDNPFGGQQTEIYGVLQKSVGVAGLLNLEGYSPASMSTITSSHISFPDAKGQLTLLDVTSDPGETSYRAYSWSGAKWQIAGEISFENRYETARKWNGTDFVPLSPTD